ncbi:MAG: hypothetical protein FWE20_03520 [Defluviitaleaceae bacterium]|nr:hypothetical protein [Defluviitaleaceae bacterium]
MINLEDYLYEKVKPLIDTWSDDGIYAISFFVYSNGAFTYLGYSNVSEFAVSYNTEDDFKRVYRLASSPNEARWNYAFWRQNTTRIIDPEEDGNEGMTTLLRWYEENGVDNIGQHSDDNQYDESFNYIGRGPGGYYELLCAVSGVARRLQLEGFIRMKFGEIPIVVHDLEYSHLTRNATKHANPNGEAGTFLKALESYFE